MLKSWRVYWYKTHWYWGCAIAPIKFKDFRWYWTANLYSFFKHHLFRYSCETAKFDPNASSNTIWRSVWRDDQRMFEKKNS